MAEKMKRTKYEGVVAMKKSLFSVARLGMLLCAVVFLTGCGGSNGSETTLQSLPLVSFATGSQSNGENVAVQTITVLLSQVSVRDVTVPFTVTGTAANPADYTITASPVTIVAGATTAAITITVVDDALNENDETVIVTMGTPTNAIPFATTVHTATIVDNDPLPLVSFATGSQSNGENVAVQTITVLLSQVSVRDVTVPFTVTETAANPADYTITASPVTIAAGATSTAITITVVDDTLNENNETVIVTMGTPTNATQDATTVHTATITDNDPLPSVSFTTGSQSNVENVAVQTITVSLSQVAGQNVTVPFTVTGTAANPADYTITASPVTIAAGATSTAITITVVDDTLNENNERVIVTMGTPTNATQGATTVHTATITDNDPLPSVALFVGVPSIIGAGGAAGGATETTTVVATLSSVSGRVVTVTLSKSGTASDTIDYTLSNTAITIAAGSTSGAVTLTSIDNLPARPNKTVIIDASCGAGSNCTMGSPLQQTVTITNGFFKASKTDANDQFGYAVAISGDGNTMAVGAPFEDSNAIGVGGSQDDNSAISSGAAYVFTLSNGIWSQQAYLKASNTDVFDRFGFSVAISGDGNTVVVGAIGEASSATGTSIDSFGQADNSASSSGAAYVFTRSGTVWTQQAYVKASNTEQGDTFGFSVAISGDGNTMAVGAPFESSSATGVGGDQTNNNKPNSGAVYTFIRSGVVWSQQAYLKASNTDAFDQFGLSVAISGDGNTVVVGALLEDSNATGVDGDQTNNNKPNSGAVYTFIRSGVVWGQQAYLKASNTDAGDNFGSSVAISGDGNTMAVGALLEDSNATGTSIDSFGQADNTATNSGAAYIFTRSGTDWSQQAYVKASNTGANDLFGGSGAISGDGNTVAVSAVGESSSATGVGGGQTDNSASGAGAVYTFTRSGTVWSQQAYVKASNTGANDLFGGSLSLSSNGFTLAVGVIGEDSSTMGVTTGTNPGNENALNSGAVYLY